ncbi:hypothetical protein ACN23B_13210 [Anabaena sp. FACHB-709]|uniref:Outer membrane protein beta-barrel domain-containing protein n=2 Tax=Nostocaceae TaxID=1162 RepID=A0A1Z4KH10_ANAVA|nr:MULTISPECIES: hypothetical protein [Nostocaceae]BAY68255.1 hypothetical protein NIES23_10390 [Trichormus variabilis NIES-23]HBW29986.1 hypothetical protein [Nostoc sp. UBA8866]MBD2169669.1 hypothetical protein [Anabaena cylindrica FACHB-318]MBD2261912.1 hypothetical protein [Anabaena sp. FACHB-709]MBD2271497.1 hypothetical protein [Nostoc sp. PCC 7120 = FACHB-418]
MNTNFINRTSTLLTVASVVIISSVLPAYAENENFTADEANVINQPEQINANPNTSTTSLTTETIQQQTPSAIESQTVAQTFEPGRATRSGASYIGVGGNIGITGNTRVGEGSFSVISKIGLTRNISARPAALVGDNTVFLLPLTVDFPQENLEITQLSVAPYIGGGVAISTGRDSTVGALITAGVDVPLSQQITATGGVNVSFIDETDVGLSIGVGYNF